MFIVSVQNCRRNSTPYKDDGRPLNKRILYVTFGMMNELRCFRKRDLKKKQRHQKGGNGVKISEFQLFQFYNFVLIDNERNHVANGFVFVAKLHETRDATNVADFCKLSCHCFP